MVLTITAPLWADISDRATRELGEIHIADGSELINHPRPWWIRPPCGRVSYMDDFEDALNFTQTSGTVSKASDAGYVHGGASAMKFVTGAGVADGAGAEIYLAPLAEESLYATLGFWVDLSAADDATPRDIMATWLIEDKTLDASYTFGLRFNNYQATVQQRKLQFWNATPAWEDIVGGSARVRVTKPEFHYFQIAIARVAGFGWLYAQARMDDQTFALPLVAGDEGAYAVADQNVIIACTTDIAAVTTMYVDDLAILDSLIACP